MPRKKEPAFETEKYPFPSRLRKLMEDTKTTQRELALAIGVRPQTVSLYVQGQSFPDVNRLPEIAAFFNVSSDYLLHMTESKNPYLSISEYTGLTEKAIESIKRLDKKSLEGLNALLEGISEK